MSIPKTADKPKASDAEARGAQPRKRYDKEFKLQAVRLLDQGQRTQRALAAELGISEVTLGLWKHLYGLAVAQARLAGPLWPAKQRRGGGLPVATAMEFARLQRNLDQMTRQRDILQKSLDHTLPRPTQRFQVIQELQKTAPPEIAPNINELCNAFNVSRSGYYDHLHKPERPRARQAKPSPKK